MIRKHVDLIAIALLLASVSMLSHAREFKILTPIKTAVLERGDTRCFIVKAVSLWPALRISE